MMNERDVGSDPREVNVSLAACKLPDLMLPGITLNNCLASDAFVRAGYATDEFDVRVNYAGVRNNFDITLTAQRKEKDHAARIQESGATGYGASDKKNLSPKDESYPGPFIGFWNSAWG